MSKDLLQKISEYMKEKSKPLKSQAGPLGGGTKKTLKKNKAYQEAVIALGEEDND